VNNVQGHRLVGVATEAADRKKEIIDRTLSEILEAEQRIASVFRFVAAFGSSILIGSLIILGSAFTYYSLFFFRARVRPGSSFLGGSPIRTRPLLIIAHRGISTGCRESCWMGADYRGLYASESRP
jgi:hypothetical protein